jgi:hypothetical protein
MCEYPYSYCRSGYQHSPAAITLASASLGLQGLTLQGMKFLEKNSENALFV